MHGVGQDDVDEEFDVEAGTGVADTAMAAALRAGGLWPSRPRRMKQKRLSPKPSPIWWVGRQRTPQCLRRQAEVETAAAEVEAEAETEAEAVLARLKPRPKSKPRKLKSKQRKPRSKRWKPRSKS